MGQCYSLTHLHKGLYGIEGLSGIKPMRYVHELQNAYFGDDPKNKLFKSDGINLFPYFDDESSIYGNIYKIKKFSNNYLYKNTDKNFGNNATNTFNIDNTGKVLYPIENINGS